MGNAGRLMALFGWLCLAALAVGLLWLAFGDLAALEALSGRLSLLQKNVVATSVVTGIALALIALDLVALLSPLLSTKEEKNIKFPSTVGKMTIEVSALEDCLKRTVLSDPAVGEAIVTISVPEGGRSDPIVCNLNLGIHEQSNVPGKADEVTTAAKRHILDVLPLDNEPEMRQRVRILRPRRERPPSPPEEAPSAPREPEEEEEPAPSGPSLDGGLIYGDQPASPSSGSEEAGGKD